MVDDLKAALWQLGVQTTTELVGIGSSANRLRREAGFREHEFPYPLQTRSTEYVKNIIPWGET